MARHSPRVSFTNFFSSMRRRLPARIASPSRSLRSSVFRRCATFARSSSAPILLWKPTCTTFYVDLFGRQGHTFCKGFSHSVSRDWHIRKKRVSYAPRCNSIPGLSLFWITGSGRSRTPPRALDRRSRLCPLPDILLQRRRAWFQSGGGSAAFFPVRASETGVQRNLDPGSDLRDGAMGRRHVALPRSVG